MFYGRYPHSLDAKGRVILPARFRQEFGPGAFMTKLGGCLAIYTDEDFQRVAKDVERMAREGETELNAFRAFFDGVADATPDKQGRVTIPSHLRDYAGLDQQVVLLGASTRFEVWDAERHRVICEEGEDHLRGVSASFGL